MKRQRDLKLANLAYKLGIVIVERFAFMRAPVCGVI